MAMSGVLVLRTLSSEVCVAVADSTPHYISIRADRITASSSSLPSTSPEAFSTTTFTSSFKIYFFQVGIRHLGHELEASLTFTACFSFSRRMSFHYSSCGSCRLSQMFSPSLLCFAICPPEMLIDLSCSHPLELGVVVGQAPARRGLGCRIGICHFFLILSGHRLIYSMCLLYPGT